MDHDLDLARMLTQRSEHARSHVMNISGMLIIRELGTHHSNGLFIDHEGKMYARCNFQNLGRTATTSNSRKGFRQSDRANASASYRSKDFALTSNTN